ncbi:UDP-galactose/UDP-glucose transporter 7 [Eurytemora carolleeae]|uniref:UDP-galactose/UDP-glucose transporter 7 n=1 Tax=Eurytemora carolleeae TaxID=1294199 RepID=UPI000C780D8B|nr:UDP-galactose/UDP-glucose transporter 7 [Eurytemora carolleeae]|eukprot:XP_023323853.1 UDP-galactose/UDP-glucose transporter 7-like [Eurytemora affinis]
MSRQDKDKVLPNSKVLSVAFFYFICSISMNFLNKAIVSSYEFNYPFTIMACQMVFTIILLDSLRISGFLKMHWFSLQDGIEFLPASLTFALHSTLSLIALHGMNIPMYGAMKRCCPLVSLILSVTLLKKPRPSALLSSSIGIITLGAVLAALGDLQFDQYAYSMGALSVFAQASYLTLVQKSSEFNHKNTLEMIYINAYNTLPVFLTMALVLGEPSKVANSLLHEVASFYYVFLLLVVSGSVLTYSQFLCAAVCSALTTSMVGHCKSVIQTVLGFYTFGGVKFHPLNIAGLVMNILGGVVYAYVKQMEGRRRERRMSKVESGSRKESRTKSDVILCIEDENRNRTRDI